MTKHTKVNVLTVAKNTVRPLPNKSRLPVLPLRAIEGNGMIFHPGEGKCPDGSVPGYI